MVQIRELLLISGFFVGVKSGAVVHSTSNESYYECQYIRNLYHRTMTNANPCLESQLTDDSRLKLLDVFNEYRRNFSMGLKDGKNYTNIFYMRYHYICEYVAVEIMNNKTLEIPLSTLTTLYMYTEIIDILNKRIPPAEWPSFGSLSDSDKDSTYWGPNDNLTVLDVPFNERTQRELIRAFITMIRQMSDPYLTTNGKRMMWPGTTHFGCSIRFNDTSRNGQDEKTVNHLTCVFLTVVDATTDLEEGTMSNETCIVSKPKGLFGRDEGLCIHSRALSDLRFGDVPCQFFYNISTKQLPVLVRSCNGEDPRTNERFLVAPDGYKCAEISNADVSLKFTFGIENNTSYCKPPKLLPGGAVRVHFVPVHMIAVLITAFVQKFYL